MSTLHPPGSVAVSGRLLHTFPVAEDVRSDVITAWRKAVREDLKNSRQMQAAEIERVLLMYRQALIDESYWGKRLARATRLTVAVDVIVLSSTAFAALGIWQTDLGKSVWAVFVACVALISGLKIVQRLPERISNYSAEAKGWRAQQLDLIPVANHYQHFDTFNFQLVAVVDFTETRQLTLLKEQETNSDRLRRRAVKKVDRDNGWLAERIDFFGSVATRSV
jgi:hypothetical protein